jgi:tetraacyldisaccharide 4'-kinase
LRRPWALPLVPLYAAGAALRSMALRTGFEKVQRLAWPVVSVGSLSAGGAGKTPFVIALAQLLKRDGFSVDVLSRGYGRVGKAVEQVDPEGDAEQFGDEPLLLAREAGVPVFVAARRYDAGMLAEASTMANPVHLLDDGFQHRQLARAADIVLVSSEDLDDWLLPAGNLREGAGALRRATVFAVESADDAAVERLQTMGLRQAIWRFGRRMVVPQVAGPVCAFCGIARPEQFFTGLERAGLTLAAKKTFRDHHPYSAGDLQALEHLADRMGASGGLITTSKDRVRMGQLGDQLAQRIPFNTVGLRTVMEDEAAAVSWLERALR